MPQAATAAADTHWTEGPARWVASIVLGAACLGGLGWSILGRPVRPMETGLPAVRAGVGEPGSASDEPTVIDVIRDDAYAQRININTAGEAELQLLPGIGPALAARIIEDREANGPFESVDDLMRIKGIGPRTVARLRDMARVD